MDIAQAEQCVQGLATIYDNPFLIDSRLPYSVWRPMLEAIEALLNGAEFDIESRTAQLESEREELDRDLSELTVGDRVRVLKGDAEEREGTLRTLNVNADFAVVELDGRDVCVFPARSASVIVDNTPHTVDVADDIIGRLRTFEKVALGWRGGHTCIARGRLRHTR